MVILASAGDVGLKELGLPNEWYVSGITILSFIVDDNVESPKLLNVLLLSLLIF
jgi:hypothetical protein